MRPPGLRGRGLYRAGPGGRGGRVCVSGGGRGSGSEGGAGTGARGSPVGRRPFGHCPRGSGCAGLCACARVFVARGRWVCICVCAGPSLCLPPAQSLLRGDVFQTGFLRRWALLQPQPEGGAPPPQASRDQGGPGTADRHLREGGGAHQGGVQRPARRVSRDGETEADGWAEEDGQTDGDEEEGGKRDAEKDSPGGERVIEKKRQTEA